MARPKKTDPAVQAAVTAEDLLQRFKDFPSIDVISRRFNNPNDPGSLPILLTDEDPNACINSEHQNRMRPDAKDCHLCKQPNRRWHLHWANTDNDGRYSQIKGKGYIPVEVDELQDRQDVGDLVSDHSDKKRFVRKGDRGKEMLMKMPILLWNHIKTLQRTQRMAESRSVKHMRSSLAERAGQELGSEAGEMIHHGGIMVESFKHSKSTLQEEAGE